MIGRVSETAALGNRFFVDKEPSKLSLRMSSVNRPILVIRIHKLRLTVSEPINGETFTLPNVPDEFLLLGGK